MRSIPSVRRGAVARDAHPVKIISWNLLPRRRRLARRGGEADPRRAAGPVADAGGHGRDGRLTHEVGGSYARAPLPGRIHGPAIWSAAPMPQAPLVVPLPSGAIVHRVCQVLDLGLVRGRQRASVAWPSAEPPPVPPAGALAAGPRGGAGRFQSGRPGAAARLSRCRAAQGDAHHGQHRADPHRPLSGARDALHGTPRCCRGTVRTIARSWCACRSARHAAAPDGVL